MDFTVRLVEKGEPKKGVNEKGNWQKQTLVFETLERIPRKVAVSYWGDRVEDSASLRMGEVYRVWFNLESREYQDRWYTEVKAWKTELADAAHSQEHTANYSAE